MNITLLMVHYLGVLLHIWLWRMFYNIHLAAWGKKSAKDSWVETMQTPAGQLFHPFYKWGGLLLLIGSSVTLLSLIVLSISKTIIVVLGGTIAT